MTRGERCILVITEQASVFPSGLEVRSKEAIICTIHATSKRGTCAVCIYAPRAPAEAYLLGGGVSSQLSSGNLRWKPK